MPTPLLAGGNDQKTRSEVSTSTRHFGVSTVVDETAEKGSKEGLLDENLPPESPSDTSGFINNRPIRFKVALILVIPLAALLLFAGLRINDSRQGAQNAEELGHLTQLGVHIAALTHELQEERGRVTDVLSAGNSPEAAGLFTQGTITDEKADQFSTVARPMSFGASEDVPKTIKQALNKLDNLPQLRGDVAKRSLPAEDATGRYTALISDLLSIVDGVAKLATGDLSIADHIHALAAFSRYKEHAAQEAVVLSEVLMGGSFAPGQYRDFITTLAHQETYLTQFRRVAPQSELDALESIATRAELAKALEFEALAVQSENAAHIDIDKTRWASAMAKKMELLREIELHNVTAVVDATTKARDKAIGNSLVEAATVLLALVVAIVISLLIARSMVRPLVHLRTSALDVAYQRLPDMVRRFRDSTQTDAPDPATEAKTAAHSVQISSDDEIGQVAAAFNAVHQEAVRVAAEQAQLRLSVAGIYINLARRSQLLVERLIRLIDKLEQGERDPDRLAELFRVDHLATRMRRNDENLLILAGAEGGRTWPSSAPLVDVLRAAIAEVEHYTRITLGQIDNVDVQAASVSPVVHIVAELLENAANFSSPETKVTVNARVVGSQTVIDIEDEGIGMLPEQIEELNNRLISDPSMDVNVSRMMGLFVVARLAHRNAVRVMLQARPAGGIVAIVALPESALVGSKPLPTFLPALPPGQDAATTIVVPPQRISEYSGEHAVVTPTPPTGDRIIIPQETAEVIPTQWRFQPADTDPTVEVPLPIFEQIESEWFRSPDRSITPTPPVRPHTEPQVQEKNTPPIDMTHKEDNSVPQILEPTIFDEASPLAEPHWEGPADVGWQRAANTEAPASGGVTQAGLPRRVPMANFVPGGVSENQAPSTPQRSPDSVRGVLSSYRRGFEQGRTAGRARHAPVVTGASNSDTTDTSSTGNGGMAGASAGERVSEITGSQNNVDMGKKVEEK